MNSVLRRTSRITGHLACRPVLTTTFRSPLVGLIATRTYAGFKFPPQNAAPLEVPVPEDDEYSDIPPLVAPKTLVGKGVAKLDRRAIIAIGGPDARLFMNGACTVNFKSEFPFPNAQFGAFLASNGRVLYDFIVYKDIMSISRGSEEEAFLLEVDAVQAPKIADHITKYRLRRRVRVHMMGVDSISVWAAWNNSGRINTSKLEKHYKTPVIHAPDPRLPSLGSRIVVYGDNTSPATALGLPQVTESDYTLHRMMNGIPEGQAELITGSALPQESNIDYMGGIDYTKGCYTGQELTIRTKHRGVVRKRILPVMLYPNKAKGIPEKLEYDPSSKLALKIPKNTSLYKTKKRARPIGRWIGGLGNIGLALCRMAPCTGVLVAGEEDNDPDAYNPYTALEFKFASEGLIAKRVPGRINKYGVREQSQTILEKGIAEDSVLAKPIVPEWLFKSISFDRNTWEKGVREKARLKAEAEAAFEQRQAELGFEDHEDAFNLESGGRIFHKPMQRHYWNLEGQKLETPKEESEEGEVMEDMQDEDLEEIKEEEEEDDAVPEKK